MLFELKYALRQFVKRPGFTAVAVLILALGIGSNTAVFTIIDSLLLRGLPVRDPEGLMLVQGDGVGGNTGAIGRFSYPTFEQFRDHARTLAGVASVERSTHTLTAVSLGQDTTVQILVDGVSGNFFSFLGVPASLGRTLTPEDDRKNAARAEVVLSYSFWQSQFGSDPAVLGRTVLIDTTQFTIVGVAPRGFNGVFVGSQQVSLWMPIQMFPIMDPGTVSQFQGPMAAKQFSQSLMARLQPGVTPQAASAELDVMFKSVLADTGISAKTLRSFGFDRIDLQPGGSGFIGGRNQVKALLDILMAVVGAVLLVACANVASLLLARTAVRQRELALRTALGAGRLQIIRQLMLESVLLAVAGGILGLLFARWGTSTLVSYLPAGQMLDLNPDARVLAFAIGVTAAAGIIVGLIPALRFSRMDLSSAMKEQATTLAGGSGQRLNQVLVAAQIAFSVCLLAGAGLFVRTLENLKNVDPGFNHAHVLTVYLPFVKGSNLARRTTVSRDLYAAVQALPGVSGATFSWGGGGLLSGGGSVRGNSFGVPGYAPAPGEPRPQAFASFVGPRFFETLGIPILQGRGIEMSDAFPVAGPAGPGAPGKIVINESLARRYFAGRDPIGRQIRVPDDQTAAAVGIKPVPYTIIGVVKDTKQLSLRDTGLLEVYYPCAEVSNLPDGLIMEMRAAGDPTLLASVFDRALHRVDPNMIAPYITTLDDAIGRTLAPEAMIAQSSGFFSLFALLLACLGLYGVLAYNVTQRTREIGVRMALGARSGDILSLVLRQGMTLTCIGCVAGVAAAMVLSHLIASRLYGVPALDPITFTLTVVLLLAVALLACWLPARRATKVDPMVALRAE